MNSVDDLVAEFNQTAKYATFCMVMCMLYANSDKTWQFQSHGTQRLQYGIIA